MSTRSSAPGGSKPEPSSPTLLPLTIGSSIWRLRPMIGIPSNDSRREDSEEENDPKGKAKASGSRRRRSDDDSN
ncbi:hypothetical protein [Sporisorium scitamineum]|uniref:Uncharacterized protein n=1 Tax=Sporisorium scitamineum TaxID=49012 RepID=A0A0F7S165_9BASI|nr:hypothetical protein [Sporisorium scitamineum]